MLERFGYAFNELDSGKRQPATEEEQLFVAVCRGEREAATEQEKVWAKYLARTRRPKKFHTLSGGKPQADAVKITATATTKRRWGLRAHFYSDYDAAVTADGPYCDSPALR